MRQLASESASIVRLADSGRNPRLVCLDIASWIQRADILWTDLLEGGYYNESIEFGGAVDRVELAHQLYCA